MAIARRANKRLYMRRYSKKKGLDTRQKLQLWQSIVRITLLTTLTGLKKLVQLQTTMIRMLFHCHSYETHSSNKQFFSQFALDPPAIFLHKGCLHLLQGLQTRKMCLPADDFLQKCDLRGTRALLQQLATLTQGEPTDLNGFAVQHHSASACQIIIAFRMCKFMPSGTKGTVSLNNHHVVIVYISFQLGTRYKDTYSTISVPHSIPLRSWKMIFVHFVMCSGPPCRLVISTSS